VDAAESAAIDVISKMVLDGPKAEAAVRAWLEGIEGRATAQKSRTVLEHTALTYILTSKFFDAQPDVRARVERCLEQSWTSLTGDVPSELLSRLPRSVMRDASREARAFHSASFQSQSVKAASAEAQPFADYVPEGKDVLLATALLAAAFTATGGSVLAGALMGSAAASLAEHFVHKHTGHGSKGMYEKLDKLGAIGKWARENNFIHRDIHHGKTYRDYTKQFENDEAKRALDEMLKTHPVGEAAIADDYGVSLAKSASLMAAAPVVVALACVMGISVPATIAFLIPAAAVPAMSKWVHPYLHMTKEEAMEKAGPVMKHLLQTRYVENISRLHYGHHKGRGGNYGFFAYFADMVFKDYKKTNMKQLVEMRQKGITGAKWER
jgi:hypothetical protein